MVSPTSKSQNKRCSNIPKEENDETDCSSIRSSVGTLSNRIRPWKREARDGHGYQHFRKLHYRGDYIKEDRYGDGTAIPAETRCPYVHQHNGDVGSKQVI